MKRKIGAVLLCLGILLVCSGIALSLTYFREETAAGKRTDTALEQLLQEIPREQFIPEDTGLPGQVVTDGESPSQIIQQVEIDGKDYIGILELPTLELTLPILGECSEESLETAPGRYFGAPGEARFVIGGHRYRRHFRNLYTLRYGDPVIFTDLSGKKYTYRVAELEEVSPYEGEYLCMENWPLSIFTCTPGGMQRVVVRCDDCEI